MFDDMLFPAGPVRPSPQDTTKIITWIEVQLQKMQERIAIVRLAQSHDPGDALIYRTAIEGLASRASELEEVLRGILVAWVAEDRRRQVVETAAAAAR